MTVELRPLTVGIALPPSYALALSRALQTRGHDAEMAATPALIRALVREGHCGIWVFDDSAAEAMEKLSLADSILIPIEVLPDSKDTDALAAWVRGVIGQIESQTDEPADVPVRAVWLLAGSAGAAPAVQSFLNALAHPPPVAFLYAQHFDADRQDQLTELVPENAQFSMELLTAPTSLSPARVLIVSPTSQFALRNDSVRPREDEGWGEGHSPDINQVLAELEQAECLEKGVIIFSGMGADGSEALPAFTAAGGIAWTQDPGHAICSGMPAAALATGCVSRTGTPEALAAALQRRYPARSRS